MCSFTTATDGYGGATACFHPLQPFLVPNRFLHSGQMAGLDGQTGLSESRHTKSVSVRRIVCVPVRVSMCVRVRDTCTCIYMCVHTYVYGFLFCFVSMQFPSEAPETCQSTHYVCKCHCDCVCVCACEYVCVRVTYIHVRTYIYGFLSIFRYQAVSIRIS